MEVMSSVDNLVIVQQEIHSSFKKKEVMLTAFLDIKKAYDIVNRKKLCKILKNLGVSGKLGIWLKNFFKETDTPKFIIIIINRNGIDLQMEYHKVLLLVPYSLISI